MYYLLLILNREIKKKRENKSNIREMKLGFRKIL